jgi:hypothetical protein
MSCRELVRDGFAKRMQHAPTGEGHSVSLRVPQLLGKGIPPFRMHEDGIMSTHETGAEETEAKQQPDKVSIVVAH